LWRAWRIWLIWRDGARMLLARRADRGRVGGSNRLGAERLGSVVQNGVRDRDTVDRRSIDGGAPVRAGALGEVDRDRRADHGDCE
jgi:hypothetical protein